MSARVFHTKSEEETIAFGRTLAAQLPTEGVVLLIGNLGAGKTTLAKGIVEGLGAAGEDDVSSPTFTLIHEYSPAVYHIDLYRLDSAQEVRALGLEELFEKDAIVLIEWGERFRELMPATRTEVSLEAEGDERTIRVEAFGGDQAVSSLPR